jgi:hypothetical protein
LVLALGVLEAVLEGVLGGVDAVADFDPPHPTATRAPTRTASRLTFSG